MLMKTKWVSRVLCGLVAAGLLCGFAALPAEENADLVPRQFQTAQQIDRIRVEDAISNVTIRTTDTDHITVDYADTTEKPLYTISVEDDLLSIHTTKKEVENVTASGQLTVTNIVGSVSLKDVTAHELIVQAALGHTSYKNVEAAYSKEEGIFNCHSGVVAQP